MKLEIYSIRDTKSLTFHSPFYHANSALAARECHELVNHGNKESIIRNYPSDFELYMLGEYETDTGIITTSVDGIKFILNLATLKDTE